LDEIWDRDVDSETVETKSESSEVVTLEKTPSVGSASEPQLVETTSANVTETAEGFQKVDEATSDSSSPGKDFEMVEEQKEDLDDLAAQIAKELEE